MSWNRPFSLLSLAFVFLLGCPEGGGAGIAPIALQRVRVGQPLSFDVRVEGDASGVAFELRLPSPTPPGLNATLSTNGRFLFTPLAAHVGSHEFTVVLKRGSAILDEEPLIVMVQAANDTTPSFVEPSLMGGTFDLRQNRCVDFNIVVRDSDSSMVTIETRGAIPQDAMLTPTGNLTARFHWCPTDAQIETTLRWPITLIADDGDHPEPTLWKYDIVLRRAAGLDCPGTAPAVVIASPTPDERVMSSAGYIVRTMISDDVGVRERPVLLYTTTRPDDLAAPNVLEFEQIVMSPEGQNWVGRIPLTVEAAQSQVVYFVVSATDNDDATGTRCDHTTDTPLQSFTALPGTADDLLDSCETCSSSAQCSTGLCIALPGNPARCAESCSGEGMCTTGVCGAGSTIEGTSRATCGPVEEVCGGTQCRPDASEPNNDAASARVLASTMDATLCAGDVDFYFVDAPALTAVTFTVDNFLHSTADIDLSVSNSLNQEVLSSASVTNSETVTLCSPTPTRYTANVFKYANASNDSSYRISTRSEVRTADNCCSDDPPSESFATARNLVFMGNAADTEASICPTGDSDFFRFEITQPSRVTVTLLIDAVGASVPDLDLLLLDRAGNTIDDSLGSGAEETITANLTQVGRYGIRIFSDRSARGFYVVGVTLQPL